MNVVWKDKYNIKLILDSINKLRSVNKDGKVSYSGFYDYMSTVLFSAIDFNPDIPEYEKIRIINNALFTIKTKKSITSKILKTEISKSFNNYLNKSLTSYKLATSLSFKYFKTISYRKVLNSVITFKENFPNKIDQSQYKHIFAEPERPEVENLYTKVLIGIKARTPIEAASKALDSIDLLRGIWNFYFNHKVQIRMRIFRGVEPNEPINKIRPGKYHTLHLDDGSSPNTTYWYEPDFISPKTIFLLYPHWNNVYKFEKLVRNKIQKSKFKEFIEDAFLRYVRAFDEKNYGNTFIKLWSLLEYLTGTLKQKYDVTIRRASFRYKDNLLEKQILNHLRDHRNREVHHASQTEHLEILVYQIKRYVEDLLKYYIYKLNTFSSLEECFEYFDMPKDKEKIKSKLNLSKRALKLFN